MTKACWPWSHKWTKWKTVSSGEISRTSERGDAVIGYAKGQERECEVCGKLQARAVKARMV